MKIYKDFDTIEDQMISSSITINSPESGFSLAFGFLSGGNTFQTGFAFSGYSGMLFDQSGNFYGGYSKGVQFDLNIHFFAAEERISYFFEDTLISNNIYQIKKLPFLDSVEFEKIEDSTLALASRATDYNDFYYYKDIDGKILITLDNLLIASK